MKDETINFLLVFVLFAFSVAGAAWIGHQCGKQGVQQEAVSGGYAHWVPTGPCNNDFVWGK